MLQLSVGYEFTLEIERGDPKSRPPDIVNPQGPPPLREMIRVAMMNDATVFYVLSEGERKSWRGEGRGRGRERVREGEGDGERERETESRRERGRDEENTEKNLARN